MNHKIYVLQDGPVTEEEDDDYLKDGEVDVKRDEDEDQYSCRSLRQKFYGKMWWIWFLQGAVYVRIAYLYYYRRGLELAYTIYIPVDCLVFVSMWIYYMMVWM